MKKLVVAMLVALMVLSLAACSKKAAPLEDKGHAAWVGHGQYLLADGTENGWNGKDGAVYDASALTPIAVSDVKAIDENVYKTLSGKEVKYLYKADFIFGTNDAGWTTDFVKDGKLFRANGSYAFKIAQCTVDVDGDTKIYAEDQWISDPKTAYAESLTPDTLFMPVWQEEPDEYGLSWASNPVVTGGPGLYTLIIAQYNNASAPDAPGYGIALVLKEAKDGIAYEEVPDFVAADHTYGIVGSFEGSNWGEGEDVAMAAAGDNAWSGEVELKAGDEFKVRADSDWAYSWGDGENNLVAEADGTYVVTITFNGMDATVEAVAK